MMQEAGMPPLIGNEFAATLAQAQLMQLIRDLVVGLGPAERAELAAVLLRGYLSANANSRWTFSEEQLQELWPLGNPQLKQQLVDEALRACLKQLQGTSDWDRNNLVVSFMRAATAWLTAQVAPQIVTTELLDSLKPKDAES